MDVEINGHVVTVEQLVKAQQTVDRINESRRDHLRFLQLQSWCREAAMKWIEANPVAAKMSYRTA